MGMKFRKTFLIVAGMIAVSLVATLGRLFVGIPFVPPSGREVVARLSGLPIPVFVESEDAVNECSPFFCMDYYGRGLIRLDSGPCAKAIDAAKKQGWRPLPLPANIERPADALPTPSQGYFRYEQQSAKARRFSWINPATCQVYAELDIQ
jgi:hypothetical protein